MAIVCKYGREEWSLHLPQAEVVAVTGLPATDPQALITAALDAPVASARLEAIVSPGEKVVIVTSDITRATGSPLYLPLLVERLHRAGVPDDAIEIVIALGIHRRQTAAEHRQILGSLSGRIRVSDHDCDDEKQLVDFGVTSSGLPVQINRTVAEADRVIVTGTVGLHYFAGFGGGRKGLVPGVASRATCMATHFAIFNPAEIGGRQPLATAGNLAGNPVHGAILEAARRVRPDFLFNTVLAPDKRLIAAFAGDLEAAHLAACDLARAIYTVPLAAPAELAVVSCGGHPKDINFVQAHKAFDYGVRALVPGGTLILLAACPDGFGNATFADWLRYRDLGEFEQALRARYEINGQTALATLEKSRRYRTILVSEFSAAETALLGMEKAQSLDRALEMAYEKLPKSARTVVIPDGGTILPVCPARS